MGRDDAVTNPGPFALLDPDPALPLQEDKKVNNFKGFVGKIASGFIRTAHMHYL
jgi:hypothetical protein